MQSILIVSTNNQKIDEHIKSITKGIEQIDLSIIDYQSNPIDSKSKNSIGINEIKNFQKKLYLKPLKSKEKAVVLKNCENLTVEAQNALLKVLEEPPANTTIILTASSANSFLSTVLSRVKIIELKDKIELEEKEISQYLIILTSLISLKLGDRLKLAQDLSKNKEEGIVWLEKMILSLRQALVSSASNPSDSNDSNYDSKKNPSSLILALPARFDARRAGRSHFSSLELLNILISLNKTHTILSTTNANPRLALENLFLNLQN